MGRRYVRDRRGRFASVGATARGGRLTNLSGKRYERRTMTATARTGVLRPGAIRRPAAAPAAGPANSRVPFSRPQPGNNIRPAKVPGRGMRALDRAADNINAMGGHLKKARALSNKIDRSAVKNALSSSRLDREFARQAGEIAPARRVIQRRMERAFQVRERNDRIGARALFVYQAQLRQLPAPTNQRVGFRRKPMTPKQAARAKAKRDAEGLKRIDQALKADMKQAAKPAPKPKTKRKPRKKSS